MATRKASSTKKAAARKPAAAKTTVRTISASAKKPTTVTRAEVETATAPGLKKKLLPNNLINIVLAELFGTFVLTLVMLATASATSALYAGLVLAALVMIVGGISGAHVNPAVTFGLWTVRKVKSIMLPFYWGAQFLGAILAIVISSWISNSDVNLNFGHFFTFDWQIFGLELVGAAVLVFGWVAVLQHKEMSGSGRALGIGLSFLAALVVAGTIYGSVRTSAIATYQTQSAAQSKDGGTTDIPHVVYDKGAVLNPAASLAISDSTKGELTTGTKDNSEATYSHLSVGVILGTFIGAALGGNLYLLIVGRTKNS
ncbi:MAG: aquaporin [Candidatus Saccharimonas sp.]